MTEEDWNRGRACQRCYVQKLKCRRPPGQAICMRCAGLHAQCRPRPRKERGEGDNTIKLASLHRIDSSTNTTHLPSSEPSSSTEVNESYPSSLLTLGASLADTSTNPSDLDFTGSGDKNDWQDPFLLHVPSISAHTPAASSATHRAPNLNHADLPVMLDLGTQSADSKQLPLDDWINNIARLNSSICAFQQRSDIRDDLAQPARSDFETVLHMAVDFSALVAALNINRPGSGLQRTHGKSRQTPWYAAASSDLTQTEYQVAQILADTSNILLLTSIYGRLLALFHAIISRGKSRPTLPQLDLRIGLIDIGERPVMQSFIVVNVIELLVRRMDHILDLANDEADTSRHPYFYDARRQQHTGRSKGLSMVMDVTRKQQKDLLDATADLRAHLLRATSW